MKMNSKSLTALTVLAAAVGSAQGIEDLEQQAAPSPHAVPTSLPGVYAFRAPPANFDARSASAQELADWGYPPRPNERQGAEAYARWLEEVNPALKRSVPDLVPRRGVYHRPAMNLKISNIGATSNNWSGFALVPTGGAPPFYYVTGRWIVPTVKQPPGTCSGGWDNSSQWVGIGGFNDGNLLQAGSATSVFCDVGGNIPEYYPWIEWLPAAELVLYKSAATQTLYPFAPGDYLIVTVWSPLASWNSGISTSGQLSFADVTQGWTASLSFTAASLGGSQVTGQSAEWIVERPEIDGTLSTLADYVADPWWNASAGDLGAVFHGPGTPKTATPYNITMLDGSNADVSHVTLYGSGVLWFFPEGSAIK